MRQLRKSYPKSFKTHQVDTIAFGVGPRGQEGVLAGRQQIT
ncbi:hypothetical protein [Pseudomonas sp. BGI-2]|nr:hypothetical protein [Pseudomonas sp. BGI-2]